jgi:hypothetical protein
MSASGAERGDRLTLDELIEQGRRTHQLNQLVGRDERWHRWQDFLCFLAGALALASLLVATAVSQSQDGSIVPDVVLILACLAALAGIGLRWMRHRSTPMHRAYLARCRGEWTLAETCSPPAESTALTPRR